MLAEEDAPEEDEEEADGMASRVRWAETLRRRLCAAAAEERVVGMVERREEGGSPGLLLTKPCVAGSVLAWTGGVSLLRCAKRGRCGKCEVGQLAVRCGWRARR